MSEVETVLTFMWYSLEDFNKKRNKRYIVLKFETANCHPPPPPVVHEQSSVEIPGISQVENESETFVGSGSKSMAEFAAGNVVLHLMLKKRCKTQQKPPCE